MKRTGLLLAAALIALTARAFAQSVAPSAIVADPGSFEGKAVTVSGTISNLQVTKSMFRKVTGFQLCDTKCVVVIDQTNAAHKNGEQATVSGTFQSSFKGPKRTFKNVVVVK